MLPGSALGKYHKKSDRKLLRSLFLFMPHVTMPHSYNV